MDKAQHNEWPRTGRPPTRAPLGMVSTPHYLASAAGLRALHRGGSAVDAVIAANAVLCVAYPHMAGLGGDGFWLIHKPGGEVEAIDAAGPSARQASIEYYNEQGVDSIPSRGALAALTVPGAVDGWRLAHERHGRLEWASLFDDAIRYARDGLPVARSLADWLVKDEADLNAEPRSAKLFLRDGKAPAEGERLVLEPLARTFEVLARDGARAGFYEGSVAKRICDTVGPEGSPLRTDDFVQYHAEWVEPIKVTYKGHDVYEFPPPTQGFAALQLLKLIEGMDVDAWGDASADYFHHMAEAVKVAFADRDEWLTDPKFVDIPLEKLLSDDYIEERRKLIRREEAMEMEKVEPGIRFGPEARKKGEQAESPPGRRPVKQGTEERARRKGETSGPTPGPREQELHASGRGMGDTVYLTAVDEDGLAVSAIQSIYHDFGSAVVGGDTGIILQNRGSHFSLDEHVANRLEPGKRTFHTLTPGMALKDGKLKLAFGTMGGEGQPQTHAAMLTRILDFGHDVQSAIEAPRWLMGRTWGVKSKDLSLEGRIPDDVVRELRHRGQPVKMLEDWNDNMGHAAAILVRDDGFLEGGADPRGDGAALGY